MKRCEQVARLWERSTMELSDAIIAILLRDGKAHVADIAAELGASAEDVSQLMPLFAVHDGDRGWEPGSHVLRSNEAPPPPAAPPLCWCCRKSLTPKATTAEEAAAIDAAAAARKLEAVERKLASKMRHVWRCNSRNFAYKHVFKLLSALVVQNSDKLGIDVHEFKKLGDALSDYDGDGRVHERVGRVLKRALQRSAA
jgi:hypothetical protein